MTNDAILYPSMVNRSQKREFTKAATKAFDKVKDELFVNDEGVATFAGVPFSTPFGVITSSLKGKIS